MDSSISIACPADGATAYPKIYRPSPIIRFLAAAMGMALFLLAVVLAYAIATTDYGLIFPIGFLGLAGILLTVMVLSVKITLYRDRIEQSGLLGTKTLSCRDILGYRSRTVKSSTFIDLVPFDSHLKKISVTQKYTKDEVFKDWLKDIQNLDEAERKAVELQIEQDESLGATPEERKVKVESLRKSAKYLTYLYLVGMLWAGIYPEPLWLAVAFLFFGPWVAIALVWFSGGHFTIIELNKTRLMRKSSLLQLIMLSAGAFYLIFRNPINGMPPLPLDWQQLLIPSIVGTLFMFAVVIGVSRGAEFNAKIMAPLLPALIVYVGGSLNLVNGIFDHADPKNYQLHVQKKHNTTGRGSTYWLDVTNNAGDSYDGEMSVRVPYSFYFATNVNDNICAKIHPGALGMKWETVDHCSTNQSNIAMPMPGAQIPKPVSEANLARQGNIQKDSGHIKSRSIATVKSDKPELEKKLPLFELGESLDTFLTEMKAVGTAGTVINTQNNGDKTSIWVKSSGIRLFFGNDEQHKLEVIRFDAPYSGSARGVSIGDTLDKLNNKLGNPIRPPWGFGDRLVYLYNGDGNPHTRYDIGDGVVKTIFLLDK